MIRIAICDDDKQVTAELENIIGQCAEELTVKPEIDIFFDGKKLIEHIEKQQTKYDIIFLDIEMKQLNGMKTAQWIRERDRFILLVFVTSHSCYALEAYEVHPFQFLVKPLVERTVRKCFEQAYELIMADEQFYEFYSKKEYYRIFVQDIMYFESQKRIINIHMKDGTILKYYDTINNIENKLQETKADFLRIHQSILVNSRYVFHKAFDHVELTDKKILTVSEDRRKELNAFYVKAAEKKLKEQ